MKIKKLTPTPRRAWQDLLAEQELYPANLVGVNSKHATHLMIEGTKKFRKKNEEAYKGLSDINLPEVTEADVRVALSLEGSPWRERLFLLGPSIDPDYFRRLKEAAEKSGEEKLEAEQSQPELTQSRAEQENQRTDLRDSLFKHVEAKEEKKAQS